MLFFQYQKPYQPYVLAQFAIKQTVFTILYCNVIPEKYKFHVVFAWVLSFKIGNNIKQLLFLLFLAALVSQEKTQ